MNNEIQVFTNDNLQLKIRAIKNEDGSISINAEDYNEIIEREKEEK